MQSQGDLSSPFCPWTDMPSAAARCQVQQVCGKPIGLAMHAMGLQRLFLDWLKGKHMGKQDIYKVGPPSYKLVYKPH